jgi:thermitase
VNSRRITSSMFLLAALAMVAPFSVAAGAPAPAGIAATPSVGVATPQAADRSARATIGIGDTKNQVIVHFRDRAAFRSDTAHRMFGQVVDENPDLNSRLLRVPDVSGAIRGLGHNPNVLFAEQNPLGEPAFDPNDPLYYSSQWHLGTWAATHGSNLRGAWDLTAGYKGAKIVIVDTGLDYTHPDFAGKNPTGYNFAENSSNWYDCFGHGTEVTGTAAATTNNGVGVAGVDMWTGIYVAKIYAGCTGNASAWTAAKAISETSAWAGTKVINISSRWLTYSAELDSAVQTARNRNVVVVAAAGNDNMSAAVYPAALSGVLAVAATDKNGARASFSNFGSNDVDVAAPGVGICTKNTGYLGGGYTCVDGTSFASPLVAGIAMLVRSRYPYDDEASIRARITAASYNPELGCWNCYSSSYGFGVVNAYYAAK